LLIEELQKTENYVDFSKARIGVIAPSITSRGNDAYFCSNFE